LAGGVFLVRLLDLFWLVAPDLQGHGEHAGHGLAVHWLRLAAPSFLGGVWLLLFVRELRSRPLLTPGDPSSRRSWPRGQRLMSEAPRPATSTTSAATSTPGRSSRLGS